MTTDARRSWEKTIEEYLDGCEVGSGFSRAFDSGFLDKYAASGPYKHVQTSPAAPDYEFHFYDYQYFKIIHAPTGEVAGAFMTSMAYVAPEHRGKGLTSILYVMCDDLNISKERVRSLTPASLGAFRKAHAMMVERALRSGEKVPLRVLSQYRKAEGGGITLRKPYGPQDCNDRIDFKRNQAQAREILAVADTQDASFVLGRVSSNPEDVKAAARYPLLCRPQRAHGLRVAAEAAKAGGGTIRMIVNTYDRDGEKRCSHLAFAAKIGDTLIDAFGATHEDAWADKLKGLDLLDDKVAFGFSGGAPVRTQVRDFETAGECVAWMRQDGVAFKRGLLKRDREVEGHAMRSACDYAAKIREPENVAEVSGI